VARGRLPLVARYTVEKPLAEMDADGVGQFRWIGGTLTICGLVGTSYDPKAQEAVISSWYREPTRDELFAYDHRNN
jgi:hypothetical protein